MTRPNIVYVMADQLRRQSCGYAGDALANTPHIDRLADEGMSFENAVVSMPVCSAYRASLFTGKHTTSTGMVINELRLNPEHHPHCLAHCLAVAAFGPGEARVVAYHPPGIVDFAAAAHARNTWLVLPGLTITIGIRRRNRYIHDGFRVTPARARREAAVHVPLPRKGNALPLAGNRGTRAVLDAWRRQVVG